jgi:hypothetical protein
MNENATRRSGYLLADSAFGWDWYVKPGEVVTRRRLLRTPITRFALLAVPHNLPNEREVIIAGREGAPRRRFSDWRYSMLHVDVNCTKRWVRLTTIAYFDGSGRIIQEDELRPLWKPLDQIRQDSPLPRIAEWACQGGLAAPEGYAVLVPR